MALHSRNARIPRMFTSMTNVSALCPVFQSNQPKKKCFSPTSFQKRIQPSISIFLYILRSHTALTLVLAKKLAKTNPQNTSQLKTNQTQPFKNNRMLLSKKGYSTTPLQFRFLVQPLIPRCSLVFSGMQITMNCTPPAHQSSLAATAPPEPSTAPSHKSQK